MAGSKLQFLIFFGLILIIIVAFVFAYNEEARDSPNQAQAVKETPKQTTKDLSKQALEKYVTDKRSQQQQIDIQTFSSKSFIDRMKSTYDKNLKSRGTR